MKSILVGSSESYSGKSAVCLGIGIYFVEKGYRVGYMKPLGNLITEVKGVMTDGDAYRAKVALKLKDSLEDMSPVLLTQDLMHDTLNRKQKNLKTKIKKSFSKLSRNKDIMILEGAGDVGGGSMFGLSSVELAKLTKSKIVLISKYDSEYVVDRILSDVKIIGDNKILVGVIINDVPVHDIEKAYGLIRPFLEERHIPVIGVIPQDKGLKSVTVKDVVENLNGKLLAGSIKGDDVISSFLVGAMSPANALKHFRSHPELAVITGGDRVDIQMAALEANVKCIILTGNLRPNDPVLVRAEELDIPLVMVGHDTITTVHMADELINRIRVDEGKKLTIIRELIENVDFDRVYKSIGLKC